MFGKMKEKYLSIILLFCSIFTSVNISFANRIQELNSADLEPIAKLVNTYAKYCALFITIFALGAFVYNIVRLGTSSGDSSRRENAIRGMMISGIVAALIPFSSTIMFLLLKM